MVMLGVKVSTVLILCLLLLSALNVMAQSMPVETGRGQKKNLKEKVQQIYTSQIGVRENRSNSGPQIEKYLKYVHLSKGNPWCAAFVCWVFGQAGISNPRSGWSPDLFKASNVISERGLSRVVWEQRTKSKEQGPPTNIPFAYPSSLATCLPDRQAGNRQLATEVPRIKYQESRAGAGKLYNLPRDYVAGITAPSRGAHPPSQTSDFRPPTSSPPAQAADVFGLFFPEKGRIAHVGFIDQWDGTWMISVEGNTNVSGSREGDGVYRKRRLIRSIYSVARYISSN